MFNHKRSTLLLFCFLLVALCARAQYPGSDTPPAPDSLSIFEVDTLNVRYFYQENPGLLYSFSDTLLDQDFQHYDPARYRILDQAHLGNLGSAHYPIVYQPEFRQGFDLGFHQFDLYKTDFRELPFYVLDKPFSDLFFTQAGGQQETYFKAKFSRNFANGLNYALDYKRINDTGKFRSQRVQNTVLSTGFWYQHPNKKYNAFISYTSNTFDQQNNGGIDTSLLTVNNSENEFNFPIYINGTSETRHVFRQYTLTQHYDFVRRRDSSLALNEQRRYTATHQILFESGTYKFFDTAPAADSSFYQHLQVDNRGLRHFIRERKLENTFWLSTSSNKGARPKESRQNDLLRVGLRHRVHWLKPEPGDTTINNLLLLGEWRFAPNERIKVRTYGHFALWDNAGDYRAQGDLDWTIGRKHQLQLTFIQQSYAPNLLQTQLSISETPIWQDQDFKKTFATSISATYRHQSWGTKITLATHLLNNYIYYDTLALPQQTLAPVNISQLIVEQNIKVGPIHLDNSISLQTVSSDNDVLRLPNWYAAHSLYYEGKIFRRVMRLRAGVDVRWSGDYFANFYQPLTGQFHLQDEQEIRTYPSIDAFISFKVKAFRFFFRGENIYDFFTDEIFYQIPGYPFPYFHTRFGISWQLIN